MNSIWRVVTTLGVVAAMGLMALTLMAVKQSDPELTAEESLRQRLGEDKLSEWRHLLLPAKAAADLPVACEHEHDQQGEENFTPPTPEAPWSEGAAAPPAPAAFNPDLSQTIPYAAPGESVASGPYANATSQPEGTLSDFIIYTNPGHGFTAGTSSWFTQRGINFGMVEDLGNLDQFNFFVTYCFNAGATIVPFRPVGYQPREVVLDNDSAGVTFAGAWSNSTATVFYGSVGDVPYRFASVADAESATARYTPNIPASDFYPVYTWVNYGTDRIRQLYRIRHSGGVSEVRVNHKRVGRGWVWLGTYHFEQGTDGWCEISNLNNFTGQTGVVIADTIRFGNGMGDISRGAAGVSGHPRELENARYWIQNGTGQGMSAAHYDGGGDDASDNVSAPPKTAAMMNQSTDGSFYDRLIYSIHSNAAGSTARGALGLGAQGDMPVHQYEIATMTADEVNNDMEALDSGVAFGQNWGNNTSNFYDGVTYGEIRDLYLQGEMTGTLNEVGFHSNNEDANIMQDARGRNIIGRACYQSIVKFINTYGDTGRGNTLLPDQPTHVRATNNSDGTVTVGWRATVVHAAGGHAPTGYRVYRSANGYGFGDPVTVNGAAAASASISGLTPGEVVFFRVAAFNAGGESMATETVGVRVRAAGKPEVLVVNGFRRMDRFIAPKPFFAYNLNGNATTIRPRQMNAYDYIVQHGKAIAAAGYDFDSCSQEAFEDGNLAPAGYKAIVWMGGQQGEVQDGAPEPEHEAFNAKQRPIIQNFVNAGGGLFVSGSEIAWDMDRDATQTDTKSVFLQTILKADFVDDDVYSGVTSPPNSASGAAGGIFDGVALTFDNGTQGTYNVDFPDVVNPSGGSAVAMNYTGSGEANTNAATTYDGANYRAIFMGFPFETITSASTRNDVMKRALDFLIGGPVPFGPNKIRLVRHILEIETIYEPVELQQADYNVNTKIEVGDVILAPE